ncbi:MAG TPA: amidohydrolase family protein [Casimicrobiaceae bacterium]|nr:amidohydrolase family protein [Casimicrobiaceae bacterium]
MNESMLIRGGRVVRRDLRTCDIADVLIRNGRITAIERPGVIDASNHRILDASDRLLIPGLVDGHTHGHGALAKGQVEDRSPLEVFLCASGAMSSNRTVADKRLAATLSAVELIRKGCTACYDLFVEVPTPSREGLEAVAGAYADVGMRAVVAPMLADRSLYQALPGLLESLPEPAREEGAGIIMAKSDVSLAAARDAITHWPFDRDVVRPAIAPTIPLHCSDPFMVGCATLAKELDVGVQTHLAESKTQAVLAHRRYGQSLVSHLAKLGLLSPRFSAAHGIWIDDDDIAQLADADATLVHNPMSNLRLGSGVAPARTVLDAGLTLGIGTDASNTSDGQNMFEAMRLAAYLSRIADPDPARWLSVEEAFHAATLGSATALGFRDIGRLETGYAADIVFLDTSHINYVPLRAPLLQVVFAENGAAVDSVMIDGRMVLEHGRMLTIDERKLRAEAEEAAARLDAMNADAIARSRKLGEVVGHFCLAQARAPFLLHRRLPDR